MFSFHFFLYHLLFNNIPNLASSLFVQPALPSLPPEKTRRQLTPKCPLALTRLAKNFLNHLYSYIYKCLKLSALIMHHLTVYFKYIQEYWQYYFLLPQYLLCTFHNLYSLRIFHRYLPISCASRRIYSGVVPQQPPTTPAPASISVFTCFAKVGASML